MTLALLKLEDKLEQLVHYLIMLGVAQSSLASLTKLIQALYLKQSFVFPEF